MKLKKFDLKGVIYQHSRSSSTYIYLHVFVHVHLCIRQASILSDNRDLAIILLTASMSHTLLPALMRCVYVTRKKF